MSELRCTAMGFEKARPVGDSAGGGDSERSLEVSLDESEANMLSESILLVVDPVEVIPWTFRRWIWDGYEAISGEVNDSTLFQISLDMDDKSGFPLSLSR